MPTVTAKELRDNSSNVLSRVCFSNERVSVTRNGKPVAAVVPLEDVALLEQLEDALDALDALEGIREAEAEGTISLEELRALLGEEPTAS
jgi:prevent-host-death family protein